jgi:hypothetical protein
MKLKKSIFLIALPTCLAIFVSSPALAQHGEHEQDEAQADQSQPETYKQAIHTIEHQLGRIEKLIDTNDLDNVHSEAEVVRDTAKLLARLALQSDSGIPRTAIREINLTAKKLAATFGPIDEAGDSGDLAGTKKVYEEMVSLYGTLEEYIPHQRYACPMGHESGKIFTEPQACSVCGMQLKLLADTQYSAEVSPAGGMIRAGQETTLSITLADPAGGQVKGLQVVDEKALHLMVVSKDLSWYSHEHPVQQADGTFSVSLTFPQAGEFVLFHDFTPEGEPGQVLQSTLRVQGTPPAAIKLVADHDLTRVIDGYTVRLDTHGSLSPGGEATLAYEISRDGKPVTDLEPYLGAMGHVVIISRDLEQYVHAEQMGGDHQDEHAHDDSDEHDSMTSESQSSTVSFQAQFPTEGLYKSWAQFRHRGRILTVPFVIHVEGGLEQNEEAGHHEH